MRYTKVDARYNGAVKTYLFKDSASQSVEMTSRQIKQRMSSGDSFIGVKLTADGRLVEAKPPIARETRYRVYSGRRLMEQVGIITSRFTRERDFVVPLYNTVLANPPHKVSVLFGIRSSGKTIGMYQCINRLVSGGVSADVVAFIDGSSIPGGVSADVVAFIDGSSIPGASVLENLVNRLISGGVKHLFIDEVSGIKDILSGLAYYANHIAGIASVVMAGTDSYMFAEAFTDVLYHRYSLFSLNDYTNSSWCAMIRVCDKDESDRIPKAIRNRGTVSSISV
ncbi:hypothetical protein FACS189490_09840 [Clostridia bacterium]|nr:hypothetical protein FACS189490_09840 [Clostridia bacterium]